MTANPSPPIATAADPVRSSLVPGPVWICLVLFILYLSTAIPSLGWRDNPEFAASTHTLGIAHPAGFPTYSLLTKAVALLPVGSIPFRLSLAAALFTTLSLYLLHALIARPMTGEKAGSADDHRQPRIWAATWTVAAFGISSALWSNATEIEVYSLNLLFLVATLTCLVRWSEEDHDSWLLAGGFIFGLAAGNHATVAFYLPGLLLYFLGHSRRDTWRRCLLLVFFFLVGFSVYLYLPIRAAAEPGFNFGDPENLKRFLMHITNRKSASDNFSGVRQGWRFFEHLWIFLSQTTPRTFWPVGLPLLLLGVWRTWRGDRPLTMALILIGLGNLVFFIRWTNPTAFLPTFFIAALWCGFGLAWLLQHWGLLAGRHAPAWNRILALGLAIFLAAGIWLQYPIHNRSNIYLGLEEFRHDYETLPPDAISLVALLWFHQRAYQDVYRMREDVTVLGLSDFLRPEHFNPITAARFPRVTIPPGPYTFKTSVEYLKTFLRANLDEGRDIYWEPIHLNEIFYPNLIPAKEILFKFVPQTLDELSIETVQASFDRLRSKIARGIDREKLLDDHEIDDYYVSFMIHFAEYLRKHTRAQDALAVLRFIEAFFGPQGKASLTPGDHNRLTNQKGVCLLMLGRLQEAEDLFKEATARDDTYYDPWANLAMIYLKTGRPDQAYQAARHAIQINPNYPEAYLHLGDYYRQSGDRDLAGQNYRLALEHAKNNSQLTQQIQNRLQALAATPEESS